MPLDTNYYWQQTYNVTQSPFPWYSCCYNIKVIKDSIIGGVTYKFLRNTNGYCSVQGYSVSCSGFLKQDTIKKILTSYQGGQERILYNFNKIVGDTTQLWSGGIMTTYTVTQLDSLLLNDGLYHKRFTYFD
jgi:hypothetical protein